MNPRLLALLWLLIVSGTAGAQPGIPGQTAGPGPLPEAAPPDTVTARVEFPEGFPPPLWVTLKPDTLYMGQEARLGLGFPESDQGFSIEELMAGVEFSPEWFRWDGTVMPGKNGGLVMPVKIYQINPFQVQAGDQLSEVVLVDLRAKNPQETAAIRDPRRWGWNLWTIITGGLLAVGLFLLGYWAWTARKIATEKLPDWPLPQPAWLGLSQEMVALQEEGLLARGDARQYLDRLAGICRRYVAGRFNVGAVEKTGPEIRVACARLGQPERDTSAFVELLAEMDSSRYDPERLSTEACLAQAARLVHSVDQVRIMPVYTPVPAATLLAGEKSWSKLHELLPENPPLPETMFSPGETGGGD